MSHGQKSDARNVKLISALILTVFRFFRKVEISHFLTASIELDKSFKDYVSLQDNGRAYFLHEYVYKGKYRCNEGYGF